MKKFIEKIKNVLKAHSPSKFLDESLDDTMPLEPIEDVEAENNKYIWLSVALILIVVIAILIACFFGNGNSSVAAGDPTEMVGPIAEGYERPSDIDELEIVDIPVEVDVEDDPVDIIEPDVNEENKAETKKENNTENKNESISETKPVSKPENKPATDSENDIEEPEVDNEENVEITEPEEDETELNLGAADNELEMLAIVIFQEAGGDAYCDECRRRVADVVLNRVADPRYPDTIYGVLTQKSQYGRLHWTGVVWPSYASNPYEADAVERAYRIAGEVLNGHHSSLYGAGYIYQAEFKQGTDNIYHCGHYFGR